jgi:hypothetical protein
MGWVLDALGFGDDKSPVDKWLEAPKRGSLSKMLQQRYDQSNKSKRPYYSKDQLWKDVEGTKKGKLPNWM